MSIVLSVAFQNNYTTYCFNIWEIDNVTLEGTIDVRIAIITAIVATITENIF